MSVYKEIHNTFQKMVSSIMWILAAFVLRKCRNHRRWNIFPDTCLHRHSFLDFLLSSLTCPNYCIMSPSLNDTLLSPTLSNVQHVSFVAFCQATGFWFERNIPNAHIPIEMAVFASGCWSDHRLEPYVVRESNVASRQPLHQACGPVWLRNVAFCCNDVITD